MKVWFSHGKESGPWGSKIQRLANTARARGCDVDSVDYRDLSDPDQRVERLTGIIAAEPTPCLLVGSSMGGYVSLAASQQVTVAGVFLLAPALYLPGYRIQHFEPPRAVLEIVHGWSDEVIQPENVIRFARQWSSTLHLIDGDHRLNAALDTVVLLFEQFLGKVLENQAARADACSVNDPRLTQRESS